METQDRKQVVESVTIAALSALVTGLINWAFERAKEAEKARRQKTAAGGGS